MSQFRQMGKAVALLSIALGMFSLLLHTPWPSSFAQLLNAAIVVGAALTLASANLYVFR